ncbi:MAG: hypothetical protein IJC73_00295 [Lentisphaeria bacterium]|nr:hypothetical protein [Lentisphaeria bacterium]
MSRMRGVVMAALSVASSHGRMQLLVNDSSDPVTAGEAEYFLRIIRWLDLCRPDDVRFQSRFIDKYREAAARLITGSAAYCDNPDRDSRRVVRFQLPPPDRLGGVVRSLGSVGLELDPRLPVIISNRGVRYSPVGGRKRQNTALTGMHDLVLLDVSGTVLFHMKREIDEVLRGRVCRIRGAVKAVFTRYQVVCDDMLSLNEYRMPLDSLADPILLDGGGVPSDLLTNTLDDIVFGTSVIFCPVTDVTALAYQTLFFAALGYPAPAIMALPPVEPDDIRVDQLRRSGYLADSVISVLAQTGYTTGQRPMLRSVRFLMEHFEIDRISDRPAVLDREFLLRHNREDLRDLPPENFAFMAAPFCRPLSSRPGYPMIAALMQPLTDTLADARQWNRIFSDDWSLSPEEQQLRCPDDEMIRLALQDLIFDLEERESLEPVEVRRLLNELESRYDRERGVLARAVSLVLTGWEVGLDVAQLIRVIGPAGTARRLRLVLEWPPAENTGIAAGAVAPEADQA